MAEEYGHASLVSEDSTENTALQNYHGIHTGAGSGPYENDAHDYITALSTVGTLNKGISKELESKGPVCDYIPGGAVGRHGRFSTCNKDATHFAYTSDSEDPTDILSTGIDHRSYLTCAKHANSAITDLSKESGSETAGRAIPIESVRTHKGSLGGAYRTADLNNRIKNLFKRNKDKLPEIASALPKQTREIVGAQPVSQLDWVAQTERDKKEANDRSLEVGRSRQEVRDRIAAGEDPMAVASEVKERINPSPPVDPNYVEPAPRRVGRPVSQDEATGTSLATVHSLLRSLAGVATPPTGDDSGEQIGRGKRAVEGFGKLLDESTSLGDLVKKLPNDIKFTEVRTQQPRTGFRPTSHPPYDDMTTYSAPSLRNLPAKMLQEQQTYEIMAAISPDREADRRARVPGVIGKHDTGEQVRPTSAERMPWHSKMSDDEAYNARMTIKSSPDGKNTPLIWDPATNTAKVVHINYVGNNSNGYPMHTYEPTTIEHPMPFHKDELHDPESAAPITKNYHYFKDLPELGALGRIPDPTDSKYTNKTQYITASEEEPTAEEVMADTSLKTPRRPYRWVKGSSGIGSDKDVESVWKEDTRKNTSDALTSALKKGAAFWKTRSASEAMTTTETPARKGRNAGRMSDEDYEAGLIRAHDEGHAARMKSPDWIENTSDKDKEWLIPLILENQKRNQDAVKAAEAKERADKAAERAKPRRITEKLSGPVVIVQPANEEAAARIKQEKEERMAAFRGRQTR
jgi:hypothetical protein